MKRAIWGASAILLLGLPVAHADSEKEDSASKVMACMQANVPTTVKVRELKFETSNELGASSTVDGHLYMRSEDKGVSVMFQVVKPANLSGASYLIREMASDGEEGMYVYLPAVKRVRRVRGSFSDGALMGTSFSYNDFRLLQNSFEGSLVSLEGTEQVENRPSYQLLIKSAQSDPRRYSEIRLWVDQKTCVALKGEFKSGSIVQKTLYTSAESLMQSSSGWYASKIQVNDEIEGRRTVMTVKDVAVDENMSSGIFNPKAFFKR